MLILEDTKHNKIAPLPNAKDVKIERDLQGNDTLSFSYAMGIDDFYSSILPQCFIVTPDQEYVIKEVNPGEENYADVVAVVNTEDLKSLYNNAFTRTDVQLSEIATNALVGSGWTFQSDVTKLRSLSMTNSTALDILKKLAETYMCDINFDAKNKIVTFKDTIGSKTEGQGVYFIDKLNLASLEVQSNTYDFCTRLIPVGQDNLYITDVNAGLPYVENYQYCNQIVVAYWDANQYTDKNALKADAIEKLKVLSTPTVAYKANVRDLANLMPNQYKFLNYKLGDFVRIRDNQKQIEENVRIVKTADYPFEPENNQVELNSRYEQLEDIELKHEQTDNTVSSITTPDGGGINGDTVDKIDWTKVQNVQVVNAQIGDAEITTAKIGQAQITTALIQDATITTAKIGDLQVTNEKVVSLSASKISTGTLDASKITVIHMDAGSIDVGTLSGSLVNITNLNADNIVAGTLDGRKARISHIDADEIVSGTIDANLISVINLSASNINTGYLNADRIYTGTLTGDKLVAGTITATQIAANTITAKEIDSHTITANEIATDTITAESGIISAAAIGTAQIQDAAITGAKIEVATIETANIKNAAITTALIDVGAVNTQQVADGSITDAKIVSLTANKITAGTIDAGVINVVNLNADHITAGTINGQYIAPQAITDDKIANATITKAKISQAFVDDLNATYATITNLNSANAEITNLKADKADIEELNSAVGRIGTLETNSATITELNSTNGKITNLTSNVATIQTLVNGNITSANMAVGAIKAGDATIANGAISSAQIISLDVSKLNAGNISTNKFVVISDSGNLKIQGNTLHVWDNNGKERISLGLNGTDYNLLVRGSDGNTVLFGTNGVTHAGITDGAVDDSKVVTNANISGSKIEKESLVTQINGATATLKSSKIKFDDTGQTLDVAFSSLSSTVSGLSSTTSSQGTAISVVQGAITSKVWQTDIASAIDGIQLGGTNLIDNGNLDFIIGQGPLLYGTGMASRVNVQIISTSYHGTNSFKLTTDTDTTSVDKYYQIGNYGDNNLDISSDYYTFSAMVFVPSGQTGLEDITKVYISLWRKDSAGNYYQATSNRCTAFDTWTKLVATVPYTNASAIFGRLYMNTPTPNVYAYFDNIQLEKGNKATDYKPSVNDTQSQITTINSNYSTLSQTVSGITSTVGSLQNSLDSTNGNVTSVTNRVSTVEQSISGLTSTVTSVQQNYLKSSDASTTYATQTSVSSLSQTVNSLSSTISSDYLKKDDAGNTYATQSTVSNLQQDLDGFSFNLSSVQTDVNKKAYSTDVASSINSAVDGISIGGTNYITNGNCEKGMPKLNGNNGFQHISNTLVTDICYTGNQSLLITNTSSTSTDNFYQVGSYSSNGLDIGTNYYTFSTYVYVPSGQDGLMLSNICLRSYELTSTNGIQTTTGNSPIQCDTWQRISVTRHYNNGSEIFFRVYLSTTVVGAKIYVDNLQLETGNKATAWSPALEDVQGQIDTANSNITSIQTTVSSHTSSISALQSSISLKLESSTFSNYQTTVDGEISSINTALSTQSSSITLLQNSITSKVTQTDIDTSINNLSVGGTNLLLNSSFIDGMTNWAIDRYSGSTVSSNIIHDDDLQKQVLQVITSSGSSDSYARCGWFKVKPNTQYTFSYNWVCKSNNPVMVEYFIMEHTSITKPSGSSYTSILKSGIYNPLTSPYNVITFTTKSDTQWIYIRLDNNGSNDTGQNIMELYEVKVEEGNKATAWSPAPEDVQGQIDTVNSNIGSIQTTVSSHTSSISALQSSISLKLDSSTFSNYKQTVDGEISSINSTLSSQSSSISVLQTSITSKVTQTDINTSINNINIGGINLLLDSSFELGIAKVTSQSTDVKESTIDVPPTFVHTPTNGSKCLYIYSDNGDAFVYTNLSASVQSGKVYTLSFDYSSAGSITGNSSYFNMLNDENYESFWAMPFQIIGDDNWHRVSFQWTCPDNVTYLVLRFGLRCSNDAWISIDSVKLEEGNKATAWSPAPEDGVSQAQAYTDGQISTVNSSIATHTSEIAQLNNDISLKVSTSDYNGNTIASLINQTATTIDIDASKINLNGYVTVSSLSAGGSTTIDGSRITTGYINADRIGANSITTDKLLIGDFTNLCNNPDFENDTIGQMALNWYNIGTVVANTSTGGIDKDSSSKCLQIPFPTDGSGGYGCYNSSLIPVQAGDQFYVKGRIRWVNPTQNGNAIIGFVSYSYSDKNTPIDYPNVIISSSPTDWRFYDGTYTVPSGVGYLRIRCVCNQSTTGSAAQFDDIEIRRINGSTLIQNGAITTDKIVSDAVTADKIAAHTITANEIASNTITSAEIKTGSIVADDLQAGTITSGSACIASLNASKITTGTLDANLVNVIHLNASNITAGTISGDRISGGTIYGINIRGADIRTTDTSDWVELSDQDLLFYQNGQALMKLSHSSAFGTPYIQMGTGGARKTMAEMRMDANALVLHADLITPPTDTSGNTGNSVIIGGLEAMGILNVVSNYSGTSTGNGDIFAEGVIRADGTISSYTGFSGLGQKPAYSDSIYISNNSSITIYHGLGYHPFIRLSGTLGNLILTTQDTSLYQTTIYCYSGGGGSFSGYVYMW